MWQTSCGPVASVFVALTMSYAASVAAQAPKPASSAGPVIVIETMKGNIEIETYPTEAPKTVAAILALIKKNFYNGLRFHRVEKKFLIQAGDPQSRDLEKHAAWGRAGSGVPIGVAEITKLRPHKRGAVGMAHAGDPTKADSQFYITLSPRKTLDGKYAVFGQVISGMDVAEKMEIGDRIRRMAVK